MPISSVHGDLNPRGVNTHRSPTNDTEVRIKEYIQLVPKKQCTSVLTALEISTMLIGNVDPCLDT